MSVETAVHIALTAAALSYVILSFREWGNTKLMLFGMCAILTLFTATGSLLTAVAQTASADLIGVKIKYTAAFIPPFYLFAIERLTGKKHSNIFYALFLVIPLISFLGVALFPYSTLVFSDFAFTRTGGGVTRNTIMAVVSLLYGIAVATASIVRLFRSVVKHGKWKVYHAVPFLLLMITGPVLINVSNYLQYTHRIDFDGIIHVILPMMMFLYSKTTFSSKISTVGRDHIVEHMQEAYVMLDPDGCFVDANAKALEFFPILKNFGHGTPIDGIDGLPSDIFAFETQTQLEAAKKTAPKNEGETEKETAKFGHALITEGNTVTHLCSINTVIRVNGKIVGTCVMVRDDTESQDIMEQMKYLAQRDSLMGIYNRRTFYEFAESEYNLYKRKGDNGAVIMIDLDKFKRINDTYGHAAGDTVLKAAAARITSRLRKTDICGRYGGEEIVIWLPDTSRKDAIEVAEELRVSIEQDSIEIPSAQNFRISITASFGVVACVNSLTDTTPPESLNTVSFQELVGFADKALYAAKQNGRNRVEIYD